MTPNTDTTILAPETRERAVLFSPSYRHGVATADIDMCWERTRSPIPAMPAWQDHEGRLVTIVTRPDQLRALRSGTVVYFGYVEPYDYGIEAEAQSVAEHRGLIIKLASR